MKNIDLNHVQRNLPKSMKFDYYFYHDENLFFRQYHCGDASLSKEIEK